MTDAPVRLGPARVTGPTPRSFKPELDAEIIRLYEEGHLRQRSIAGRLGISESVVSKRLQRIYARRADEEWQRKICSDDWDGILDDDDD